MTAWRKPLREVCAVRRPTFDYEFDWLTILRVLQMPLKFTVWV